MASLTRDPTGNWIARYRTGGRGSRLVYENLGSKIGEREARRRAAALEEKGREANATDPNITFTKLAEYWSRLHVAKRAEGTRRAYGAALKHLTVEFGGRKVRTIKPVDAEVFAARREAEGAKPDTRRRELMVLHAILNFGEMKGLIDRTPLRAGAVTRPEAGVRHNALEPEEWVRFDTAADGHSSQPLWRFMVLAACRISEACALSWRDVDSKAKLVRIYQAKTKRTKVLVITPAIEAVLKSGPTGFPDTPVFRNASGERWTTGWAAERFEWLRIKAKLRDGITPHALRKTAATLAFRAGISKDRILGLLGDSTPAMIKHYVFDRPADFAEAQAAVEVSIGVRPVNDGVRSEVTSG
ncbi:MAG: tyrosine-type recombinase/integrase [Thermoanaerobaculia bacterium]